MTERIFDTMFQSLGSGSPTSALKEGVVNSNRFGLRRSNAYYGNKHGILTNLFRREVHGTSLNRLSNPFGDNGTPARLKMPIEDIIPATALEAGNVFMGFTNCGRYLLSYTCRPSENFGASVFDSDGSYMYTLHIWLFIPYRKIRKVSQICLFDNNGVYDNNLLIEISQWDMDDSHILITGRSENPESECHHTFYASIITIPDAKNCPNCVYMHDDEQEDDAAGYSRLRANCIDHGLTLHMKYDHVAPYPKLNADVQLRFRNTVLLNTGNLVHMVSFKLIRPVIVKTDACVVPAASLAMSTTKVPLRCDIWLKIINANLGALGSMKYATQKEDSESVTEGNIISVNALDSLLLYLPNSCSSKPQTVVNVPERSHRRLSQSSTDSDFSIFSPKSVPGFDFGPMSPPFLNRPRSPRRGESSSNAQAISTTVSPSKLMLPPQERKFFKRRLSSQSLTSNTSIQSNDNDTHSPTKSVEELPNTDATNKTELNQSAFDVFEMRFEDTAIDRHLSSFKTFRKRRLADKKYEFNDVDQSAENIIPLKMTRRKPKYTQHQGSSSSNPRSPRNENENTAAGSESPRGPYSEGSHPRSPRAHHIMSPVMSPNYVNESLISEVLRPLNNNSKVNVVALSPNHNLNGVDFNDVGKVKEESSKEYSSHILTYGSKKDNADVPSHPHSKPTMTVDVNCVAKVLRSYIQKEDDNMSVITDIEDEMCQGYPFPVALPLEVHGAGYQQLQMISNSKAEKFQVPVVQVLQRTLDIEMLCNEVANIICMASDKHYCSCIDFDLTFADANPDRGTVTAIVVMVVQATLSKPRSRGEKLGHLSNTQLARRKYEAFFSCEWVPSREHCRILYKSNLQELDKVPEPWHPTENMESLIKAYHTCLSSPNKTLTNALAVHDWQSLDELADASGIVTLYKDEGHTRKTDRRLNDFNSLIFEENHVDLASIASTTTESDDEWGM